MKMRKSGTTLSIRLDPSCAIAAVEKDADALRALPEDIRKIILSAGDVEEIDTAYLQLLFSLKAEAARGEMEFQVKEPSEAVMRVCRLYNVSLTD